MSNSLARPGRVVRAWLTRSLLAAAVNVALLGPLPPTRRRLTPAIVITAGCRDSAERLRRANVVWVITLPWPTPDATSMN
jgi:hypothetical protein